MMFGAGRDALVKMGQRRLILSGLKGKMSHRCGGSLPWQQYQQQQHAQKLLVPRIKVVGRKSVGVYGEVSRLLSTLRDPRRGDDRREPPPEPREPPKKKGGSLWSSVAGVGALASLALGKTKYLLVALKVTKAAPLVSMVLSSAAYSLVFGPAYGCGMVGLVFCHECGHALVMHRLGVPFSPMVFIPFMGAVIAQGDVELKPQEDAAIALGGPILGSAAAFATAGAGHVFESQLLMALGDWGLIINLFNLLPIGHLDGGRVADAISPWLSAAGLGLGGIVVYAGIVSNPIFYLVLLGGTFQVGSRIYDVVFPSLESKIKEQQRIKKRITNRGPMVLVGLVYAALVASLLIAMRLNNQGRKTPSQIRREKQQLHHDDYGDVSLDDDYQFSPPPGHNDGDVYDDYFASWAGPPPEGGGKGDN